MEFIKILSRIIIIAFIAQGIYWIILGLGGQYEKNVINIEYFFLLPFAIIPGIGEKVMEGMVGTVNVSDEVLKNGIVTIILNLLMLRAVSVSSSYGYKTAILVIWSFAVFASIIIVMNSPLLTLLLLVPAIDVFLSVRKLSKKMEEEMKNEFGSIDKHRKIKKENKQIEKQITKNENINTNEDKEAINVDTTKLNENEFEYDDD